MAKKPAIQTGQGHPSGIIGDIIDAGAKAIKNRGIKSAKKTAAKSLKLNPSGKIVPKEKITKRQLSAHDKLSRTFADRSGNMENRYSVLRDPDISDRVIRSRQGKKVVKDFRKNTDLSKGRKKLDKELSSINRKLEKDLRKIDKKRK